MRGACWRSSESGFVVGYAHVRGGGEFGRAWHRAGQLDQKPNSWRDLIAVCDDMCEKSFASPARLAIGGRSAGGVVVGRAMTERPELFAALVCEVGWFNPLRYVAEQNSFGEEPEWGSLRNEAGYRALKSIDSYQSVQDGRAYPAVLLTTGITDPRVAPFHAAKMAARLQAASSSGKPVLLRVDFDGGPWHRLNQIATGPGSGGYVRFSNLADEWFLGGGERGFFLKKRTKKLLRVWAQPYRKGGSGNRQERRAWRHRRALRDSRCNSLSYRSGLWQVQCNCIAKRMRFDGGEPNMPIWNKLLVALAPGLLWSIGGGLGRDADNPIHLHRRRRWRQTGSGTRDGRNGALRHGLRTSMGKPVQPNCGTLFKLDPATGTLTTLHTFAGAALSDGSDPRAALIYVSGILYGTTAGGGPFNAGTVFKFDVATAKETVIHHFAGGMDGATPMAALTKVGGLLYSTTSGGGPAVCGAAGCGTVFNINMKSAAKQLVYGFHGTSDGQTPLASVHYISGTLYGTTSAGGSSSSGSPGFRNRVHDRCQQQVAHRAARLYRGERRGAHHKPTCCKLVAWFMARHNKAALLNASFPAQVPPRIRRVALYLALIRHPTVFRLWVH